jgi:hypothetical protein
MKKILAILLGISLIYSCTEAGDGSEMEETGKDTMSVVNPGSGSGANDTSAYERMPNRTSADSTTNQ